MPVKTCRKCGRLTNTAVSDWIDSKDEKADRCFAAFDFVNGKWMEGCSVNEADNFTKGFVSKLIKGENK